MILKFIQRFFGLSKRPKLKVRKLAEEAIIPYYKHEKDSGMDLHSIEEILIPIGQRRLVRTGLAIQLPSDTEAQIRPRSGLAINVGITITNSPGTVDESFRGEVKVIVENRGNCPFAVEKRMRIAQMVICPVIRVEVEEDDNLSETTRAGGGFGSTGL